MTIKTSWETQTFSLFSPLDRFIKKLCRFRLSPDAGEGEPPMGKNRVLPYFLDDKNRDLIVILPGGGYQRTSPREHMPIVEAFQKEGYHCAVLEYRNELLRYPEVLTQAVELISPLKNDKRIKNIFINGYSSGGHLSLMLLESIPTFFQGGILAYPVVTSDPRFSHAGSFQRLLGEEMTPSLMKKLSLEKHVSTKMPPIFLWHTMDDTSVPVENSLLLLKALRKQNIPVEAHFFPKGRHGLSLATNATPFLGEDPVTFAKENAHVAEWFPMAINWLKTL